MKINIIRLHPEGSYFEKASEIPSMELGQSRMGGPAVDLPKGLLYPKNFYFAAQLDLEKVSKYDMQGLLPKRGFLYFFIGDPGETGKVFYSDTARENLQRVIKEHTDWFWRGKMIGNISHEIDDWESHFREYEEGEKEEGMKFMKMVQGEEGLRYWQDKGIFSGDKMWDYFAGMKKTKIYGIYSDPQKGEDEIREIMDSNKVLLLQIGEDVTEAGVWNVLIDRDDLKKLNLDKCEFRWAQT